ncbi:MULTISPECIES: GcrA family cell cycle regulator [Bradyrhizobium]|uniref:GcrA family cell cycle regulator n=1 Tax=Bradyrhizobium TaxID=374 RepID=UPI003513C16D
MSWDDRDVALLKELWALGHSATQIARRLGCSRNAACGRLTRLDLKRGHKPSTAKPKIRSIPKQRPTLSAACTRPAGKKGVETLREAAAQRTQQGPALRHVS